MGHGVMASSSATNHLERGYVPFDGNPVHFDAWKCIFRSLMHEAGLGKVMSGAETAPAALDTTASADEVAAHQKLVEEFDEKNGKLFTRLLLATSDCADGYASVAFQVVQTYAPIGIEGFGDGRSAIVALEAEFRVDGVYRMQELYDKFGSLDVSAADNNFDPARVIQELRRICIELGALGDNVVPARKTHAFLKSLPDKHYGSLKTVLLCERPSGDRVALDFDDLANRATSYHAIHLRGKISSNDDGSYSPGRALNTVVHGGGHGFRRQGGRGQGRGRRGNSGGNSNGTNTSSNSGGNSTGNGRGARGSGRGSQLSIRRGRGNDQDSSGRNYQGGCRYRHSSTEHGWHNCPLRLSHEAGDAREDEAHPVQAMTSEAW